VLYGLYEPRGRRYKGSIRLEEFINHGRKARSARAPGPPLAKTRRARGVRELYRIPKFEPRPSRPAGRARRDRPRRRLDVVEGVIIDETGEHPLKAYQLSKGNPIQDTKELLAQLKEYATEPGRHARVIGFGATGYAADVLEECVLAT
jgi:hypothetical protein